MIFSKNGKLDALRGRIRREVDDQHLRLGTTARGSSRSSSAKKSTSGVMRHLADVGAGDDRAVDVDRIARVGHQHRVAAVERREHQVRDALLRADRDDRLGVRIELDAVAALVPLADRAAQPRNALRHRVAVRVAALRRLDQLVDDVRGRRPVGIAHAEVDDVLAAPAGRHLSSVGDVEDVRRQALDARELRLGDRRSHGFSTVSARNRPSDEGSGTSYNPSEFTGLPQCTRGVPSWPLDPRMKFHLQAPTSNVVHRNRPRLDPRGHAGLSRKRLLTAAPWRPASRRRASTRWPRRISAAARNLARDRAARHRRDAALSASAADRAADRARVGIEVMDTRAACRTYNILVAEGRNVTAALIVE